MKGSLSWIFKEIWGSNGSELLIKVSCSGLAKKRDAKRSGDFGFGKISLNSSCHPEIVGQGVCEMPSILQESTMQS